MKQTTMAKSETSSQLLLTFDEAKEEEDDDKEESEVGETAERFKCITLHKRGVKLQRRWRQEQRLRAARMEFHLSVKWALDDLIEEQLSRFDAHYSRAMGPCRLKDIPLLLHPKCRLPLEMAALGWLGNWRPTAILSLLRSLAHHSERERERERDRALSQLIRQTRVEETVIDQEMAEIQATCILHLPFGNNGNGNSGYLYSEFKKIHGVITKAQKLRYRTLELAVKKLLDQKQAAQFLVAFAGIQDATHEFATYQKRQKGPISVTSKAFSA